jgi:hypothetical protein
MRRFFICLCFLGNLLLLPSLSSRTGTQPLQVVPMSRSEESNEVSVIIEEPKENRVYKKQPLGVQIRLDGFPLRSDTDNSRKEEIYNDPEGQSLHIIVDNLPYFSENISLVDALNDSDEYFEQTVPFDLPMHLSPGKHFIRVIPTFSYNESLKGEGCFAIRTFYIDNKKDKGPDVSLKDPFLTYHEPQGTYDLGQPILLDFYLNNCDLSKDGYKVLATFDNDQRFTLTAWVPYYIYGLPKGTHTVSLRLVDKNNRRVPGFFNEVERTITIE